MAKLAVETNDVVGRKTLAPDPSLVKSLGANHTLSSAVADLIDNSVDAGATRVVVRLLISKDHLVQVEVVDNGSGMSSDEIDTAMTIGRGREYMPADVGHFGLGLKSASLGFCDVLTVWSTKRNANPVGRRIRSDDYANDFSCEVLSTAVASGYSDARATIVGRKTGTTVIWNDVKAYRGNSAEEARSWLAERTGTLRAHLGVTYHRLLADGRLAIELVEDDLAHADGAIGIPIVAVDPFGYRSSGHPGYPKRLVATVGENRVSMACHIWPAKSDLTGFRIGGQPGANFQGFYIYRNDRLLQTGGWSDSATSIPSRQLARVIVDADETVYKFLRMNPEKSGLKFNPSFQDAVHKAKSSDGVSFLEYLLDAENVFSQSNKRKRTRKPVIRPGKGISPTLHKRLNTELSFIHGTGLDMKWKRLPEGEFLDIDYPARTVWLNQRYRPLFAPEGGSMNDSPVVKALVFLLTHEAFEGQHLGPRDKDQIALWKSVLGAAVVTEEKMRGK